MSPISPNSFAAPRVAPNAWHAFGGIWRLTVRRFFVPTRWLVLAGLLVLLALFSVPAAASREAAEEGFLSWAIGFYATFLVPIMAFISAAGAMRDEMKPATVDYVLTRPLRRPALVVYKYLAHVGCAQVDFLCALGVVVAVGTYWQVPGLWAAVPLLLLAQVLVVIAFSAFGFLAGVLTSRYVILGLLYGAAVEIGVGQIPTQLNRLSMTRQVREMLEPLAGSAGMDLQTLGSSVLGTVAWLLAFAGVMLAVAAALFARREFAGSASPDT